MPVYSYRGQIPVVDPAAFVHPTATLIGDVIIGARCYIGPGASLRGDFGRIIIETGANVQDNCVLHSFPARDCRVEENGHVGHAAVLHGCRVGRNALVGMSAVVMDDAVIGEEALIAALSFVKAGFVVPARTLAAGSPARIVREIGEKEVTWKVNGTGIYQALAQHCLESLRECEPLTAPEPDRRRLDGPDATPLHRLKQQAAPRGAAR